ncbi:tRNA 2-selenouridine(34) synthase MnmH [Glaciimonas immobilis]|uniref:tRNA 2-selenouridine synthase n=1 Tax=Glaciimonas immobilis TaxID=728004 RepID=A0A840RWN0_9BURK|nr:tRNA 2-selenouridine(34) synthase MnmH [Glaciimonas immobilis]KAF3996394.1 tRNA 2-selenouridine(34) synthase MnmH [Glaciimonas immobilis]MBB5201276.1 tRNA 2-selenouridine synthase [Glaciimonas immobilis]
MKYPALLSFADILPQLEDFDAIIDARSPGEFAEDHIPGAVNCPVLTDAERVQVGTMYKQVNVFEAKKLGAALIARNIATHIETLFIDKPKDWKPLIYCWRGGNRSGAMAHILAKIGWPVVQLDGGYKEYRRHVSASLAEHAARFTYNVVCGPTGSGKSRLLQVLASQGAQVLDLEQLAAHRGSVLGNLPTTSQPSQKAFESSIWHLLQHFDPAYPVFAESESKKVGNLRVPDALMNNMRGSSCIALALAQPDRVQLLMDDYLHFVTDPALLNTQLSCLTALHGRDTIARWQKMALDGNMEELVEALLVKHYDPAYLQSIKRNFAQFGDAQVLELPDISDEAFEAAARALHRPV